jgi:hypothetical protein
MLVNVDQDCPIAGSKAALWKFGLSRTVIRRGALIVGRHFVTSTCMSILGENSASKKLAGLYFRILALGVSRRRMNSCAKVRGCSLACVDKEIRQE